MRLDKADVVIIGAGVSGLSSAWWLAKNGIDTVVVEKGVIGAEASSRNGGDIGDRAWEPPVHPLALESLRLWPQMDDELGYPTEFTHGTMYVPIDEKEVGFAKMMGEMAKGSDAEHQWLDGETVREMVPIVSPDCPGGSYAPDSGHANPQRSVQAYAWGFLDQGGWLYEDTLVTGFRMDGEKVTALETSRGDT